MSDPSDDGPPRANEDDESADGTGSDGAGSGESFARTDTEEGRDLEALRRRVEEKYDFEDFGPAEMDEMTPDEWDVAFDPDTWITGEELLERVETELQSRIAVRDVFAVLEYAEIEGERCLVAYSDSDYAIVYPDGSVEGRGTVVRDVKPTVALCSMDDYEVDEPPENWQLPRPEEVPETGSELGNWMLQLLGGSQILIGIAAIAIWMIQDVRDQLVLGVAGMIFIVIGVVLLLLVANARLSEKFRVREYRHRLRSIGLADGERPEFLPIADDAFEERSPPGAPDDGEATSDGGNASTEEPADDSIERSVTEVE